MDDLIDPLTSTQCSECDSEIPSDSQVCPVCLEGDAPAGPSIRRWVMVGGILSLVMAAAWWLKPVHVPLYELVPTASASTSVPCQGKERCVVAYVAPWCGACKASEPVIQAIQERFEDDDRVEVVIVAGQDSASKLEAMAERYGESGWTDPDGRIFERLSPRVVPSWYVLDGRGKVIESVEGTHMPLTRHLDQLGMLDYGRG